MLRAALASCQFYSFDCEMSGLFLQGQEDYAADDVDERYVKTAAAAEQFLVTQFGLSLFSWSGSGYEARSFNFHLFPSPAQDVDVRFTCQASSLAFLASQGFDFNKVCSSGSCLVHSAVMWQLPCSCGNCNAATVAALLVIPWVAAHLLLLFISPLQPPTPSHQPLR